MTGDVDLRILRALPMNAEPRRWPTADRLADDLDLQLDVVRSVLKRLHDRTLIEHDGEHRRAWARTPYGDHELEHAP